MFERNQEDMILGMQIWLGTKSLSKIERQLIEDLRDAAVKSKDDFLKLYVTYMQNYAGHLAHAALKAEDEGIATKRNVSSRVYDDPSPASRG